MRARLYRRPKTATQSGVAGSGVWTLDWHSSERETNDPLMGWWGSSNTQGQVRLSFDTQEEAVAFAKTNNITLEIEAPPATKPIKPKVYADNFRYGRTENWTH